MAEVYVMNNECNAKNELLRFLASNGQHTLNIKCAKVKIVASTCRSLEQFGQCEDPNPIVAKLKLIASRKEKSIKKFLDKLDVTYDCGYGSQELFGTVWLHDGTWLSREEYNGSEGWFYHKSPQIDEDLL